MAGWFTSANEVAAEFAGVAQRRKEQSALVHLEQAQLTITDLAQQLRAANKQLFDEIQGTQLLQVAERRMVSQRKQADRTIDELQSKLAGYQRLADDLERERDTMEAELVSTQTNRGGVGASGNES